MITLNDGRSELWQWDTNRKLTVDAECSQVHFSNKVFGRSIDVDVIDGVATIPDILLQTDRDLIVWAFVGTTENGYTKISKAFKVNRRNKPADYVFTPVEQMTIQKIEAIAQSVRDDADAGLFNGENGISVTHEWKGTTLTVTSASGTSSANLKGDKGIQGERGEQGAQGPQGPKGEPGKDGIDGKDGFSPVVDVEDITGGHRVTITDKDGENTFDVMDGKDGEAVGGGGGINVTGATPGQMILVKAVDEEGKPTEWEAVDRTHYSEYEDAVIYSGADLVPDPDMGAIVVMEVFPIIDGTEYTVNWNGVDYVCTCTVPGDEGIYALGNTGAISGEGDTGEPFVLFSYPTDGYFAIIPLDGSASVTVTVSGKKETVHELDEKFISQALAKNREQVQSIIIEATQPFYFKSNVDIQLGNTVEEISTDYYANILKLNWKRRILGNFTILGHRYTIPFDVYKRGDVSVLRASVNFDEASVSELAGTIYNLRILMYPGGVVRYYLRVLHRIDA